MPNIYTNQVNNTCRQSFATFLPSPDLVVLSCSRHYSAEFSLLKEFIGHNQMFPNLFLGRCFAFLALVDLKQRILCKKKRSRGCLHMPGIEENKWQNMRQNVESDPYRSLLTPQTVLIWPYHPHHDRFEIALPFWIVNCRGWSTLHHEVRLRRC